MGAERRERLERLWDEHRGTIGAYLLRRTDAETAKDTLSEVFVVAWRRLEEVPEDALPWLFGVARHALANQRRSERRGRALLDRLRGSRPEEPGDIVSTVGEHDEALQALRALRPADRELLMLIAWEGLTAEQAALALGISRSALGVRLHRARRRLEESMGGPPEGAQTQEGRAGPRPRAHGEEREAT